MKFIALTIRLIFVGLITIHMITGSIIADPASGSGELILSSVCDSLNHSLNQIDQNLAKIAGVFRTSDMRNTSASDIIGPYQIDQEGLGGIILFVGDTVYPSLNSSAMKKPFDSSILQDMAINDSIRYIKPKMSQEIEITDSKPIIMISRPTVIDDIIGAAVAILIPWSFCDAIVQPRINGTNILCIVMQLDGIILYSSSSGELAKIPPENFLTEFPTFRDVKRAMIAEKDGHMNYELWRADRSEPKARDAYWSTITLHGTEWRVMIAEPVK
ncbi:MAG: hypothetical protein V1862_11185 [Methanobacteriota archaeon]